MISWQVMGDVSIAAMKDETKNVTFCTFDPFWGWGDIRLSSHIPTISAHVIMYFHEILNLLVLRNF